MTSFTATDTTLAGLGLSFDIVSVNSSFSSGEESFDSLFSLSSSHESQPIDSQTGSDAETCDHGHVTYLTDNDEPDFNYFEPYQGAPEVSDFVPWPTSPEFAAELQSASPRPSEHSRPLPTPAVERGYEADADSPRAMRRQRRRNAHKALHRSRVHHLIERVQPIDEGHSSTKAIGIQRRVSADSSPQSEPEREPQQAIGLGFTTTNNHHKELAEDEKPSITGTDTADPIERDSTDTTNNLGSDSIIDNDHGSHSSDSDDSDVDHYYDESHLNEYEYELDDRRVHYLVQHVQPIIETLPTLEELQARMNTTPEDSSQASDGLGLGLPVYDEDTRITNDLSPMQGRASREQRHSIPLQHTDSNFILDLPPPAPLSRRYEDFDTIDLTDNVSSPPAHTHDGPDSPRLLPHIAVGSPSPIILASPVPLQRPFHRNDDVLHHNPWSDAPYSSEHMMQYAARHQFAAEFNHSDDIV